MREDVDASASTRVIDRLVTTCAAMVHSPMYDFMVVVLESEGERAETRWRQWLGEKAILMV